jgi:uroporphyrin-III C-methyltransferase/precorrin-2 dehydrogenase/sirohydrochlorin ferrochelatase
VAGAVSLPALPLFVAVAGRPVILLGRGAAAEAKRRLLERAGARIVGEEADAALAIVAIEDDAEAAAAVARLRARGVLVNATDRPELCDFTLPAIVERAPVMVAIGTGGASAGLAAALRQRLEALLPATLGALATRLFEARPAIRARYPEGGARRRALGVALAESGALDPLAAGPEAVDSWLEDDTAPAARLVTIAVRSTDPDDLSLREARLLGQADRVFHRPNVPAAILDRAGADAARHACPAPPADPGPGLSIDLETAP